MPRYVPKLKPLVAAILLKEDLTVKAGMRLLIADDDTFTVCTEAAFRASYGTCPEIVTTSAKPANNKSHQNRTGKRFPYGKGRPIDGIPRPAIRFLAAIVAKSLRLTKKDSTIVLSEVTSVSAQELVSTSGHGFGLSLYKYELLVQRGFLVVPPSSNKVFRIWQPTHAALDFLFFHAAEAFNGAENMPPWAARMLEVIGRIRGNVPPQRELSV